VTYRLSVLGPEGFTFSAAQLQRMRLTAFLLCFLYAAFTAQQADAQYDEKEFVRYSVKDGLCSNRITALQQDDWGYIWIGTDGGLSRFDGAAFKNFRQGDAPLQLPSGIITRLKRYGPHCLGIFSRNGFQVLHTNNYAVDRYIIPDSTAFSTPLNSVWDAAQLSDGSFALTSSSGFYVVNKKGLDFRHDAFTISDIGRKRMLYGRDIFSTGNGQYVVYVNENEQALYNQDTKTFRPLTYADAKWMNYLNPYQPSRNGWTTKQQLNNEAYLFVPWLTDSIYYYNSRQNKRVVSKLPFNAADELNWSSKLYPVNDSTLLVNCAKTGFYRLHINRRTGSVTGDGKKYFANHHIICFFSDNQKRLWLGTPNGLLKQNLTLPFISTFSYTLPNDAYSPEFRTVYRHKNHLYVGCYSRSRGLYVLDAQTMKLMDSGQFFNNDSEWNEVRSIEMYHPDTLWIGTFAGLLWYDTKSKRYGKVLDEKKYPWSAHFPATLAPPRRDGYAWLCASLGGRVVRYHIPTRSFTLFDVHSIPALPFDKVKHIAYDSYGDVWIGGHALTRWSSRLRRFDTLINVYGGINKFNDDIVTMTADDKGSLWLHNADNGLLEYRIAEKRFVAHNSKEGLPSPGIYALGPVVNEKLWVHFGSQLGLFDTRTKRCAVYDHNDGLPEGEPTSRRISYDAQSGNHYLFSYNSIIRFPTTPPPHTDQSTALLLEEVVVNNRRSIYRPESNLTFSYKENNLRFDFTVVDFENSSYRFAYRLDGGEWNTLGTQHSLAFSNLSPGDYQVQIKAVGKAGIEKTKQFLLVVQQPFWLRPWFILLASLFFLAMLYALYRLRMRQVHQRANLDRLLSKTEMKALQAQMNPHFIFNSLNSIREMILNNENKDASRYLSKFAHLIRLTLDQSAQGTVPLRSTVDYLKRYMEMETIRNGLFTYEVMVDEQLDADETFVSPMMIQPFIENALWHGVTAASKKIHVQVAFKKQGDHLVCTIDDDGVGIAHTRLQRSLNGGSRHRSHGIANIENRIALLNEKYDLQCGIRIADKKENLGRAESGTLVTLRLPLQNMDV
jgi:ligand-binding sensor domain-containing protein